MGVKTAIAYVTASNIVVIMTIIAAALPWHSTRFHSVGFVTLFQMKTSLLFVQVPHMAKPVRAAFGERVCEGLKEGILLETAKERWCNPLVSVTVPFACDAFSTAFVLGIVVCIVIFFNFALLGVANYMLYCYFSGEKRKPEYRRTAAGLHLVATFILFMGLLLYAFEATTRLDSFAGGGIKLLAEATLAPGTEWGAKIAWLAWLCQMAAGCLFFWIKSGDEITEDDIINSQMQRAAQKAEMEKMALRVAAPQGFRTPEPSYGAMGWVQPTALPQSQPFLAPQQAMLSSPVVPQPVQQPSPAALQPPPPVPEFRPGTPNNPAW